MIMVMMTPLEYVNIPEVDLGISSQVSGEKPGQLYAYRVNNSAAYLGTRDDTTLGASVGIKMMVGSGIYRCYAQNENGNKTVFLIVNVRSKFNYRIAIYLSNYSLALL